MNKLFGDIINRRQEEKRKAIRKERIIQRVQTGRLEMDDLSIDFETRSLFEGQLQILLPSDFEIMTAEAVAQKYPMEKKPGLIFCNKSGSVNIAFNHTTMELFDEGIEGFKDLMIETIQKMQPAIRCVEHDVTLIQGRTVGFFSFVSTALDYDIFNFMFFVVLSGRALIATVNCPETEMEDWEPIALGIMNSLLVNPVQQVEVEEKSRRDFSDYDFKYGCFGRHKQKEYRLYKLRDGNYSLISNDPCELDNGFVYKDGMYRKVVSQAEISAAYQWKTTILCCGSEFEMGDVFKKEVQVIARSPDSRGLGTLGFKWIDIEKYEKWVDKKEIDDVLEEKLPVEGFLMPDDSSDED